MPLSFHVVEAFSKEAEPMMNVDLCKIQKVLFECIERISKVLTKISQEFALISYRLCYKTLLHFSLLAITLYLGTMKP